jgi:hypothetical protein
MTIIINNEMTALILLSILSALIGFGFNKMMTEGMIFEKYHDWLESLPYKPNPKFGKDVGAKSYIYSKFLYYLSKPLGLCIVCNTTWIGIIVSTIVYGKWNLMLLFNDIAVGVASGAIVIFLENKFKAIQRSKTI